MHLSPDGRGLGEHLLVSATGMKQGWPVPNLKRPVVLGTDDQVPEIKRYPETNEKENNSMPEDKSVKGRSEVPKARNLAPQWRSPTLSMSWRTPKVIIVVLCVRLWMRLFEARGGSSGGHLATVKPEDQIPASC